MRTYATPGREASVRAPPVAPPQTRPHEGAQPVQTTTAHQHAYLLGHSDEEINRLILQSSFLNDLTRHMLVDAGLTPGMRVLDIGTGAGDVALLAAEIVGAEGEVVGIDINGEVLDIARTRADEAGLTNVRFIETDLRAMAFVEAFDAAVGRLILIHSGDPVAALTAAARTVRPGGIIAFQDFNLLEDSIRSYPPHPLVTVVNRWICESAARAGLICDIGYRLFSCFIAAGLPEPELRCGSPMGCGTSWDGYVWAAESVRSFLPAITQTEVATAEEVDIDSLAARLRTEVGASGSVLRAPDVISAWTRKPL